MLQYAIIFHIIIRYDFFFASFMSTFVPLNKLQCKLLTLYCHSNYYLSLGNNLRHDMS